MEPCDLLEYSQESSRGTCAELYQTS